MEERVYLEIISGVLLTISLDNGCDLWDILSNVQELWNGDSYMNNIVDEIKKLKEERNAVILAHYYVDGAIQDIADYLGDSYYLSKIAVDCPQDVIVFAGVEFMGESAKLLSPNKTVLMPDSEADCPMAHMVDEYFIARMREKYEDLCVVC